MLYRDVLGDEGSKFLITWKTITVDHHLLCIFDNSRKNEGQAFWGKLLWGYARAIITAQCSCARPADVAESRPQAQLPSAPNLSGSLMFMLKVKLLSGFHWLSVRDCHWRNSRGKKYRECSMIKLHVSVHWRAQCHAKWPTGLRGGTKFQHPAAIKPILPDSLRLLRSRFNHLATGSYRSTKKKQVYESLYLATLNYGPIFYVSSRISRPDKIYQNSSHQTFFSIHIIAIIAQDIDWSWRKKILAQFLLNAHQPQKCDKWELEI